MNERLLELKEFILHKRQRQFYQPPMEDLAEEFSAASMNFSARTAERFRRILQKEQPLILPFDRFALWRTVPNIPEILTEQERIELKKEHFIYGKGVVCNICPNYSLVLSTGLDRQRTLALQHLTTTNNPEQQALYRAIVVEIDAVLDLCHRYRQEALRCGKTELAQILERVPGKPAVTFYEALQFFRILHFSLWCEGEYHNTVGRFDQYMLPYLQHDLDTGLLNREQALELLEEFFLTFGKDSDLYHGIQTGDNGQSLVLGGMKPDGTDGYNLLSELCLEASCELQTIDPKINLRVSSTTPRSIYIKGTELTRVGLGFPQYSNDDIVIPGLVKLGYSLEDARNYVVAACWEFIIPGVGMEIPNIGALSFAKATNMLMDGQLQQAVCFDDVTKAFQCNIQQLCHELLDQYQNLYILPAPFMSMLMDGCMDSGRDISKGARYNNLGLHGTGLSTAVDSLAQLRKQIFEDRFISAQEYAEAVKQDFAGYDELLNRVRFSPLKFGNNFEQVDKLAVMALDTFAQSLKGWKNERGGICRAGTGSAMYYIRHIQGLGATPDGRRADEPLAANYSPSLYARTKGVYSVIKSFTKPHLADTINGGPLTIEFQSSIFRYPASLEKVADLVKAFVDQGGHQLQLNSVNPDMLLDAQKHPERYPHLIVRVWGWSAYFVELDKVYQDHIIKRQLYQMG